MYTYHISNIVDPDLFQAIIAVPSFKIQWDGGFMISNPMQAIISTDESLNEQARRAFVSVGLEVGSEILNE